MSFRNWLNEKINSDLSVRGLIRLVLFLLVILLLQMTWSVWKGMLALIWSIIQPFVIGFAIAYIVHDPVKFARKHHISDKISIPCIYLILIGFFTWLALTIVPLVIGRMGGFINSVISGVNWISEIISSYSHNGMSEWVSEMINSAISALTDVQALLPGVSSVIPDVLTTMLGTAIITLLSVIISIFYCFEWDKIRYFVMLYSVRISKRFYETVFAVNEEIGEYIRSVFMLMGIRLVEYALLYFLIGHPDWMILAIATAISVIIPYIGPVAVNIVGIMTALQLPGPNVIFLILMICILSQIDEYVITPMVHSRNLKISPLWALFSVFAGNRLLGIPGIVIAIPTYLAVRVILQKHSEYTGINGSQAGENTA